MKIHASEYVRESGHDRVAACGARVPLSRLTFQPKRVTCARCIGRPYLVFYGTQHALVWARSIRGAREAFSAAWRGADGTMARPSPKRAAPEPTGRELRTRRLRPTDAGWLRDALHARQVRDRKGWERALLWLEVEAAA